MTLLAPRVVAFERRAQFSPPYTSSCVCMAHQDSRRQGTNAEQSHMRATATATAAALVRSARTRRWPPGHQASVVVAATSSLNTTWGRGAGAGAGAPAASVSISTSRSTTGDVTKKFGDPSFWEAQYSSQVCPSCMYSHPYVSPCNCKRVMVWDMHPAFHWF